MIKKCPLDFSNRLLNFLYYYSKPDLIHCELKGNTRKPKLEEGEIYYIPESYRIVDNLIQYKGDLYRSEEPKWIDYGKMKPDLCRFQIKVNKISESNIQSIDKSKITQLGIPEKSLNYKIADDKVKPKDMEKKSEMIWRLKCYWENLHGETAWEDNASIWVYEFSLIRVNPEKHKNYLDVNWYER